MLFIVEIVNSVQQTGPGAAFIVNNYILGLIWGIDLIYLFDSHSKDNGNLLSSGMPVLLKFHTLHSLESYIRSVYYSAYPMTLYFQLQFINVHGTIYAMSAIKCLLIKD